SLDALRLDLFNGRTPVLADDLAILALRLAGVDLMGEIHVTISADPRELGPLRRTFRRWLAGSGADPQQTQDVLVAVGEAASNSIEHAYGPGGGSIRIDAVRRDVTFEITVCDRGSWREPRGTNRGLGRSLMRKLMDEVEIVTDEQGTCVTLRTRLRFPT
ncbi:MAG: ATP-binding protein, partial [Actinomycetota bacterium]